MRRTTIRVTPVPDTVLVEVDDRVALITLNDPERRNAVTAEISSGCARPSSRPKTIPTCTQ